MSESCRWSGARCARALKSCTTVLALVAATLAGCQGEDSGKLVPQARDTPSDVTTSARATDILAALRARFPAVSSDTADN